MPALVEDSWISGQAQTYDLNDLRDCAIAVDASYYLHYFLDVPPYHEPLLSALGGLTGLKSHVEKDLDQWKANGILPLFVFDGQPVHGQVEVEAKRGRQANIKTEEAWELYFASEAGPAVQAFGANNAAFSIRDLYPLLMAILKKRDIHFLVPPFNASAQLAYFEMINSDQVAGIMGSQELLLYPIRDAIIRRIDWEHNTVTAISKKHLVKALNITDAMFIDAMLMTGTSFLPPFPPLQDSSITTRQPFIIMDAVNILRTAEKSVANACNSFSDILLAQDPDWLDKYRRARMTVNHFIYIAESGEIKVNDYDHLTGDNHEYLGLQLPGELLHYVNTGLIGTRILSWITHGQILVMPSLGGAGVDEYKKLVTKQLIPAREQALALLIPRLHRGIQHKNIIMKVWFDESFSYTVNHRAHNSTQKASTWDVKERAMEKCATFSHEPRLISCELMCLIDETFVSQTFAKGKRIKGIDTAGMISSMALWRFLHLRGYLDDSHMHTRWGNALLNSLLGLDGLIKRYPEVSGLREAMLLAWELIRYGVLHGQNKHSEFNGLPLQGSDDEKTSLVLVSRCGTLLQLRHQTNGYTGPLNRNLLVFRSLSSAVRESDRDLLEAIVASMFMHSQCQRDRDDYLEISHGLPFLVDRDIAMGIAIKTFFDEDNPQHTREQRGQRLEEFPSKYFPHATHFTDDIRICYEFVKAIDAGVDMLGQAEMPAAERDSWRRAKEFLNTREFGSGDLSGEKTSPR